ncbi:MAG: AraC family transcriptional regulator [Kiritimatiellae bacterium]|nr:AraC family transcriptional regulator [Kiritimatiellia bacterium]MDD3544919.1 AraC family transcriptional regulator [Kiritimatiellia bacterium]MDD4026114.1 AraC family transcriptional regulator [Kiritimatiellia bacterium]
MLTVSNMQLDDIAKRSGFCHAQYLSVLFKKIYGLTPCEYRRRN